MKMMMNESIKSGRGILRLSPPDSIHFALSFVERQMVLMTSFYRGVLVGRKKIPFVSIFLGVA